jgi:hypothetical protein
MERNLKKTLLGKITSTPLNIPFVLETKIRLCALCDLSGQIPLNKSFSRLSKELRFP